MLLNRACQHDVENLMYNRYIPTYHPTVCLTYTPTHLPAMLVTVLQVNTGTNRPQVEGNCDKWPAFSARSITPILIAFMFNLWA